jgi:hypothetical protein
MWLPFVLAFACSHGIHGAALEMKANTYAIRDTGLSELPLGY